MITNMELTKCMNCKTYFELYESQRKVLKKVVKSLGKAELINLLQEMKIISIFKNDEKTYDLLNNKESIMTKKNHDTRTLDTVKGFEFPKK